jgi:hypothetical protein
MFLVLIETSGNQNYIFSTNKLKENIGASELTYRAGTSWVLEAVEKVRGASESINEVGTWVEEAIDNKISANDLRKKLLDEQEWNQPIELENTKVEIIIATSGKALFLTKDENVAKSIIRYVTHKATRYAPGLDICGVISKSFDWGNGLSEAVKEIYKKHEEHRTYKTSLHLRFLRLPVFDECATSGLPASINKDNFSEKYISHISAVKQNMSEKAFERLGLLLETDQRQIRFVKTIRELNTKFEEELDWLAVIHADGNGLGQIFLEFDQYINKIDDSDIQNDNPDRKYVNKLREFSITLDICTEKAFLEAIDVFMPKGKTIREIANQQKILIPIIPLILGGDDLTVVCDGKSALEFTQKFLTNFECQTQRDQSVEGRKIDIISKIASHAFKIERGRLSACAGIAIIKPHFPFSVAYDLAESLMQSAKEVKKIVKVQETEKDNSVKDAKPYPCSALDFQVLYDSSAVDLKHIRDKLTLEGGNSKLFARPYVVTSEQNLQGAKYTGRHWVKVHKWESLIKRVKALRKKDENDNGKLNLPNSQIHGLREALFLGREAAEARYKLIRDRYIKKGITDLEFEHNQNKGFLFCLEPTNEESDHEIYITGLLDAIEAANFIRNKEEISNEQEK